MNLSLISAPSFASPLGPVIYQAAPHDAIWSANSTGSISFQKRGSTLADIRALIEYSRTNGDLRALGRAKVMLDNSGPATIEHSVLLATIEQRLHNFDNAKTLLLDALRKSPNHQQAQFTLYSIALVQGDYPLAAQLCDAMAQLKLDWIASSCHFNLIGLQGNGELAFEGLRGALQLRPNDASPGYLWALATLAELAAAIAHPKTEDYYRQVLAAAPNDNYSATEYADWLLRQNRPKQAYIVLQGRAESDRILLLQAIALQNLGDPKASDLVNTLANRFEQARLRQESIHRHERARFLLDIEQRPAAALALAELNFTRQKERADWRLLQRARAAVEASQ